MGDRSKESFTEQYADRLFVLRGTGLNDGYAMREDSLYTFKAFLEAAPYRVRRAGLKLANRGDIRAFWVDEDRELRLSVHMFSNGDVEYVLLAKGERPENARMRPEPFWRGMSVRLRGLLDIQA